MIINCKVLGKIIILKEVRHIYLKSFPSFKGVYARKFAKCKHSGSVLEGYRQYVLGLKGGHINMSI